MGVLVISAFSGNHFQQSLLLYLKLTDDNIICHES